MAFVAERRDPAPATPATTLAIEGGGILSAATCEAIVESKGISRRWFITRLAIPVEEAAAHRARTLALREERLAMNHTIPGHAFYQPARARP